MNHRWPIVHVVEVRCPTWPLREVLHVSQPSTIVQRGRRQRPAVAQPGDNLGTTSSYCVIFMFTKYFKFRKNQLKIKFQIEINCEIKQQAHNTKERRKKVRVSWWVLHASKFIVLPDYLHTLLALMTIYDNAWNPPIPMRAKRANHAQYAYYAYNDVFASQISKKNRTARLLLLLYYNFPPNKKGSSMFFFVVPYLLTCYVGSYEYLLVRSIYLVFII